MKPKADADGYVESLGMDEGSDGSGKIKAVESAPKMMWMRREFKTEYMNDDYSETDGRPDPVKYNEAYFNMEQSNTRFVELHNKLKTFMDRTVEYFGGGIIGNGFIPSVRSDMRSTRKAIAEDVFLLKGSVRSEDDEVQEGKGFKSKLLKKKKKLGEGVKVSHSGQKFEYLSTHYNKRLNQMKKLDIIKRKTVEDKNGKAALEDMDSYDERMREYLDKLHGNGKGRVDGKFEPLYLSDTLSFDLNESELWKRVMELNEMIEFENEKNHGDNLDSNLKETMKLHISSSRYHKHMLQMKDQVDGLTSIGRSGGLKYENPGTYDLFSWKHFGKRTPFVEDFSKTNAWQSFEDWVDMHYYKTGTDPKTLFHRGVKVVKNISSLQRILGSITTMVSNFRQINISILKHAIVGRDFSFSNYLWARRLVLNPKFAIDCMSKSKRKRNILASLVETLGIMTDTTEFEDGMRGAMAKTKSETAQNVVKVGYWSQNFLETNGQIMVAIAKMRAVKVKNSSGELVPMTDAFEMTEIVDGKGVAKLGDGYTIFNPMRQEWEKLTMDQVRDVALSIRNIQSSLGGNFYKNRAEAIHHNKFMGLGELLFQFNRHVPGHARKWGQLKSSFDEEYGRSVKGVFGTLWDNKSPKAMWKLMRTALFTMKDAKNKMILNGIDETDFYNIRFLSTTMAFMAASVVIYNLIAAGGDDDKWKKKGILLNLLARQIDDMYSEEGFFTVGAFSESQKKWAKPFASLSVMNENFELLFQAVWDGFRLMFGKEMERYKAGSMYGEYKLKDKFNQAIPIWRSIYRLQNMHRYNKSYQSRMIRFL